MLSPKDITLVTGDLYRKISSQHTTNVESKLLKHRFNNTATGSDILVNGCYKRAWILFFTLQRDGCERDNRELKGKKEI
jgi:hypothetical protein